MMIRINIDKAKSIAHGLRRSARAEEFLPFDKVIAAQIPGAESASAESSRETIRNKYAQMQSRIDSASSVDEIKSAIGV